MVPRVSDRRLITYGLSPQADVRAIQLETDTNGTRFDIVLTDRKLVEDRTIHGLHLPMVGQHNVQNALAAVAIAYEMGLEDDVIRGALATFEGVKRRFTRTGEVDGITIIDDYGHHPVEIMAVLNAARQATRGQVIAVVQPHRYSRLRDLFEEFCTCFNNADAVFVADIYAAGEVPIEGVNQRNFVDGLRHHGHRNVELLDSPDDLATSINAVAKPGDLVVCLGAGSISHWANMLPKQLTELKTSTRGGAQ
jgi:UDP-N-acetylmuramate--alanine ligase